MPIKSGTVGAFDKAGDVDTICILLGDVDLTAEKLYRLDQVLQVITTINIAHFSLRYVFYLYP